MIYPRLSRISRVNYKPVFTCDSDGPVRWIIYDRYLSNDEGSTTGKKNEYLWISNAHYGMSAAHYCYGVKNGAPFVAQGRVLLYG